MIWGRNKLVHNVMSCLTSPGSADETEQLRRVGIQTSLQLCRAGAIASWEAGGSYGERILTDAAHITSARQGLAPRCIAALGDF